MSTSLQAVREGRQLSRAAVARRLGLSEQTIYRMERGKTEVKDVYLIALASVYEVDVNTLKEAIAA